MACTLAALVCCLLVPTAAGAATSPTAVTVGPATIGRPIPDGFVGLSMEYRGVSAFTGDDPAAPNPILIQLIRNLAPGQRPVLRIGGDSTRLELVAGPGNAAPALDAPDADQHWVQVARALTQATNARLILGDQPRGGQREARRDDGPGS